MAGNTQYGEFENAIVDGRVNCFHRICVLYDSIQKSGYPFIQFIVAGWELNL